MTQDFSANFNLFPAKEKKSERSPDFSGGVEFSADSLPAVIAYLQDPANQVDNYKGDGKVVKLRCAGWNAESKSGLKYTNGKISPPMAAAPVDNSIPF